MREQELKRWQHSHSFGQDRKRPGELRTFIVIVITSSMMIVEITAGIVYGSMALLADGLHMASHAVALGINAFAYVYARRHAHNERYSFGTGKVNTLGGYTGAILLAVFAAMMAWESTLRLIEPVSIAFNQAIIVAVLGLLVNGASVFILGADHSHDHDHGHTHKPTDHDEAHTSHHDQEHGHANHDRKDHNHEAHSHSQHDHSSHHDHNLKSAYLHVMADALTSLLAIFALLIGKYLGAIWMDPMMGIVGAVLVARWSWGLIKTTSAVLLDEQGSDSIQNSIREILEDEDNRVVDLHVWSVGPGIYSTVISLVSRSPQNPDHYKAQLPDRLALEHISIEIHEYHEA